MSYNTLDVNMDVAGLVSIASKCKALRRAGRLKDLLVLLSKHASADKNERMAALLKWRGDSNDSYIATAVNRLQEKLNSCFYTGEGKDLDVRLVVVQDGGHKRLDNLYQLLVRRKSVSSNCVREFWRPYISEQIPTWLVYGEPMFVRRRSKAGHQLVRDTRYNSRRDVPNAEVRYPFVAVGEMECVLRFTGFFEDLGVSVSQLPARRTHGPDQLIKAIKSSQNNIVIFGTVQSNGVMGVYQDYKRFRFRSDGTVIRESAGRNQSAGVFDDKRGALDDCLLTHVLISRRPGFNSTTSITMVCGPNSKSVARAGELLRTESELSGVIEHCGFRGDGGAEFVRESQVLLEVSLFDDEDVALAYRVVDWWPRRG